MASVSVSAAAAAGADDADPLDALFPFGELAGEGATTSAPDVMAAPPAPPSNEEDLGIVRVAPVSSAASSFLRSLVRAPKQ